MGDKHVIYFSKKAKPFMHFAIFQNIVYNVWIHDFFYSLGTYDEESLRQPLNNFEETDYDELLEKLNNLKYEKVIWSLIYHSNLRRITSI